MDIREYVKVFLYPVWSSLLYCNTRISNIEYLRIQVKIIPGGSISDCQYIQGIAFTKIVAHKKMRMDITNPRILLLNCSMEYPFKQHFIIVYALFYYIFIYILRFFNKLLLDFNVKIDSCKSTMYYPKYVSIRLSISFRNEI